MKLVGMYDVNGIQPSTLAGVPDCKTIHKPRQYIFFCINISSYSRIAFFLSWQTTIWSQKTISPCLMPRRVFVCCDFERLFSWDELEKKVTQLVLTQQPPSSVHTFGINSPSDRRNGSAGQKVFKKTLCNSDLWLERAAWHSGRNNCGKRRESIMPAPPSGS